MSNYYLNGTVQALGQRNFTSKAGKNLTVHSVQVDGTWIEVGFKQPYNVGSIITADVEYAYKRYQITPNPANPALPQVPGSGGAAAGAPAAVSSAPSTTSQASSGPSSFPIPMTAGRETAIIRQNALTNAVAVVNALSGETDFSMSEGGELKARIDSIIATAYKFAAFSSGNLDAEVIDKATE